MSSTTRKALVALAALGVLATSLPAMAEGQRGFGFQRVAGTYILDIGIQKIAEFDCEFLVEVGAFERCDTQAYMTLHAGGTVTVIDANDFGEVREPTTVGVWTRSRGPGRNIVVRTLTPSFDPAGAKLGVFLRELNATLDGQGSGFSGVVETLILNTPKDPLDPAVVPDLVVTGSVVARRFD